MTHFLLFIHLAAITPCILLGILLFTMPKGSPLHRALGKTYMVLMVLAALTSLFLPARVGPQLFHHFGYLHLLSLFTLWTVTDSYLAIRKGNIKKHQWSMINLYIGGILIAGSLALMPGRYLHHLFFD